MNVSTESFSIQSRRLVKPRDVVEDFCFCCSSGLALLKKGINLRRAPGQVLPLMAPSGLGKSTLAKLLRGFYLPEELRIKPDRVDIQRLAVNKLRLYLVVVPQEITFFATTAREPAHGQSSVDLRVNCRSIRFTMRSAGCRTGIRPNLTNAGKVCHRQEQGIVIARALLKRSCVVVFDEAKISLDQLKAYDFTMTIIELPRIVSVLFFTHSLPERLKVDDFLHIGGATNDIRVGLLISGQKTLYQSTKIPKVSV